MAEKMAVYGLRHKSGRLAGEIAKLELWNQRNLVRIEELRTRVASNLTKILSHKSQIEVLINASRLGFAVELPIPTARRTYPKCHFVEWGGVARDTLRLVVAARGEPITTLQVATAIDASRRLNLSPQQITKLRRTVSGALQRMERKGIVKRASFADSPGEYASWVVADIVE
jgi:hypothetical protein